MTEHGASIGFFARLRRNCRECTYQLREFFYQLLRVDLARYVVAWVRYVYFVFLRRRLREYGVSSGDIGVNTVHHNALRLGSFKKLIVNRSNLLLYPLSAIAINRGSPVLCIGPRTEGELLNYRGLGFRNVRGLDLLSYSPWIDVGDMHAMPYSHDAFTVTLFSFCLSYSNNRVKAAAEAIRVTRNGGIIGVGDQWFRESAEDVSKRVGYQMPGERKMTSVGEILGFFGDHVGHVFFSQDRPSAPHDKCNLVVLFSLRK